MKWTPRDKRIAQQVFVWLPAECRDCHVMTWMEPIWRQLEGSYDPSYVYICTECYVKA